MMHGAAVVTYIYIKSQHFVNNCNFTILYSVYMIQSLHNVDKVITTVYNITHFFMW